MHGCLTSIFYRTGGLVSSAVAISAAKDLNARNHESHRPGLFILGAKLVSENGLQKTNANNG